MHSGVGEPQTPGGSCGGVALACMKAEPYWNLGAGLMPNGHDPNKPPPNPNPNPNPGPGTGSNTGSGSGGKITPDSGGNEPPQSKKALAVAAAVGGAVGGLVGAL